MRDAVGGLSAAIDIDLAWWFTGSGVWFLPEGDEPAVGPFVEDEALDAVVVKEVDGPDGLIWDADHFSK